MNWLKRAVDSSIGKKLVMGLTGFLLIGFCIVHLSGNFLLYAGFDQYNIYAETLHSTFLLYYAEVALLLLFLGHVFYAFQTTLANRRSRNGAYAMKRSKQGRGSWTPSAIMFVSGAIVLGFVILHVAEFRFELRLKGFEGESPADRTLRILQDPISASVYFFGSLLLGYHLWHGFQSAFQTLGVNHPKYTPWIKKIGVVLAVVLALGFASFPVWAMLKKYGVQL